MNNPVIYRSVERHYTPVNSMENLRFDKKGYFYVLVFYWLWYERNRNNFRVPIRYRNTRGSLWELQIAWKHSWKHGRLVFPLQFIVLPNFHSYLYNYMETRKMLGIILPKIISAQCEQSLTRHFSTTLKLLSLARRSSKIFCPPSPLFVWLYRPT